jgi:hypothetical protein
MFVPCDRNVHVSGHVFDSQHKPLRNATIEFYDVKNQTDENGCFYFGGLLAAPGFNVAVTKPGYKSYREGKEFDFYDIDVTLAAEGADQPSFGVWHKLPASELSKHEECAKMKKGCCDDAHNRLDRSGGSVLRIKPGAAKVSLIRAARST